MPSVDCVIPWAGEDPHRERALKYVVNHLPYRKVIAPGFKPWVKAMAVMPAVERSEADIIVLHDADVVCDLSEAICAVSEGFAWAIPHQMVFRLSEASTELYVRGEPWSELDQPAYCGIKGGGIVVLRRETFLDIPLDPGFVGWGQEDHSWGLALERLLGPPWQGTEPLIHLWHEPQPRLTRKIGSVENQALFDRYRDACSATDMRVLIEQTKQAVLSHNV